VSFSIFGILKVFYCFWVFKFYIVFGFL